LRPRCTFTNHPDARLTRLRRLVPNPIPPLPQPIAQPIRSRTRWPPDHDTPKNEGDAGVRQFLDIGTGIPTEPNLHQVAQQIKPQVRVVYVDNDPLVLVHARALLISTPEGRCNYLDADMNDPAALLASREVTSALNLDQPVAVTFGSILMLLPDEANPWAKVAALMDAMPTGSYLVVSHPTADFNPVAMADVVSVTTVSGITFVPRTKHQVARFFTGYQLVEPGLVPVLDWRPDQRPDDPIPAYYYAGVARK
jgi:hypothetical protein